MFFFNIKKLISRIQPCLRSAQDFFLNHIPFPNSINSFLSVKKKMNYPVSLYCYFVDRVYTVGCGSTEGRVLN